MHQNYITPTRHTLKIHISGSGNKRKMDKSGSRKGKKRIFSGKREKGRFATGPNPLERSFPLKPSRS